MSKKIPVSELEKLLEELTEEQVNDMNEEEVIKLLKQVNPYGRTIEGSGNYLNLCYTNVGDEFSTRFKTTSFIAYLYRACDEWKVPDGVPVTPVMDYLRNKKLIDVNPDIEKKLSKEQKELREFNKKMMKRRTIVQDFLDDVFKFNPDIHVRSSYKPNPKDPERKLIFSPMARLSLKELLRKNKKWRRKFGEKNIKLYREKERPNKIKGNYNLPKPGKKIGPYKNFNFGTSTLISSKNESLINNLCQPFEGNLYTKPKKNKGSYHPKTLPNSKKNQTKPLLPWERSQNYSNYLLSRKEEEEKIKDKVFNVIPPQDLFGNFTRYVENNYDKLHDLTIRLYCEKPDVSLMFNPLQWHKTEKEAEEFRIRHAREMITDILTLQSGKWSIVGPFSKNKDRIKFYSENAEVFEEMLKTAEERQKLGIDMMKKKVIKKKKKNIQKEGKDHTGLPSYKSMFGRPSTYKLNEDETYLDEDGIEVNVIRVSKGGLNLKEKKFNTKSEIPTKIKSNING